MYDVDTLLCAPDGYMATSPGISILEHMKSTTHGGETVKKCFLTFIHNGFNCKLNSNLVHCALYCYCNLDLYNLFLLVSFRLHRGMRFN